MGFLRGLVLAGSVCAAGLFATLFCIRTVRAPDTVRFSSSPSLSMFIQTFANECEKLLLSASGEKYQATDGSVVGSNRAEMTFLLSRGPNVRTVCETGFNAGSSALIWLSNEYVSQVISFDLMEADYKRNAFSILSQNFPGRLIVIRGATGQTLPEFAKANPQIRCDIVLIDGGHNGEVPYWDAVALRSMSDKNTIVIWDDYTLEGKCSYCRDVRRASDRLVSEKKSIITACFNTCLHSSNTCENDHFFCVGRFLFETAA